MTAELVGSDDDTDRVDALLDALGGRDTTIVDQPVDELAALFLALREDADKKPAPELVSTDDAVRAIAAAQKRRIRRVHLTVAAAAGLMGVPLVVLLGGSQVEIALAFPVGALSYLAGHALLEKFFGGAR